MAATAPSGGANDFDITRALELVKEQNKTLDTPYLDEAAALGRDPFKVLVSCILSLRTQDKTTAAASKRLFVLADTPATMASLTVESIEAAIYPVGFYRVKAGQIRDICKRLKDEYQGRVPDTIEELLRFKGVGRKTANLVVTLGYEKDGICVDTHVHRITNRWGYVKTKKPDDTEMELRRILPAPYRRTINGLLVAFGQGVCRPIAPRCGVCLVNSFCPSSQVAAPVPGLRKGEL